MNYEPSLSRLKSSGAVVFKHPCWVCGLPFAPHGFGVRLLRYIKAREKGEAGDPRDLGRWFCSKHLGEAA
jgi:hypothetical protein